MATTMTGVDRVATPATEVPSALPVVVAVTESTRVGLCRYLEGVLGWQVVGRTDPADRSPVRPTLALFDGTAPPPSTLPGILLVADGTPPGEIAHLVRQWSPLATLGWPSDRDRILIAAGAALAEPGAAAPCRRLTIGGSAGGVGVTTVATAVAGLLGWTGTSTLAALRGAGLPWRAVAGDAVADVGIWSAASQLAGCDRSVAVSVTDPAPVPEPTDPRVLAIVEDRGVEADVDILVCRPDAAALVALGGTTAAAIVVNGDGPLQRRRLRDAIGGRRTIVLPWSARVARAGLTGRLPAGLPGQWVTPLRALVAAGDADRAPPSVD